MQASAIVGLHGADGGPPIANYYKRAVYKQPPLYFSVQVLSPQKHGTAFSYGMRITPLRAVDDRRSSSSGGSSASSTSGSSSARPYEIWRRWEDCLNFQDTLEQQYELMAREKRTRLQAGKGVKKNGLYPHEDPVGRHHRAASFESLPPGPDPHMIAKDLHGILPRLTKKGTLFRASAAAVEQRASEFRALINALMRDGDDVPTLITELRQLRTVRDFFGHWRRDHDRILREQAEREKEAVREGKERARAESILSGVEGKPPSARFGGSLGLYFSASNLSLQLPTPFPTPGGHEPPVQSKASSSTLSLKKGSGRAEGLKRQRANTSQGLLTTHLTAPSQETISATSSSSTTHSRASNSSYTHSTSAMSTHQPLQHPASAPSVTFTFSVHSDDERAESAEGDGFISASPSLDTMPMPEPASPRSSSRESRSLASPNGPLSAVSFPCGADGTRNSMRMDKPVHVLAQAQGEAYSQLRTPRPIIVPQDTRFEGMMATDEDALVGEEQAHEHEHDIVLREHEHLMPHAMFDAQDAGFHLHDLTIAEEDEEEPDCRHSPSIHVSPVGIPGDADGRDADALSPGAYTNSGVRIPRTPRRDHFSDIPPANRNARIFMSPASSAAQTEDDDVSLLDGKSVYSTTPSRGSFTHVDPTSTITGHASAVSSVGSIAPSRLFYSPPGTGGSASSRRTSWASASATSAASCMDIDTHLAGSPLMLHSPLYDSPLGGGDVQEALRQREAEGNGMWGHRAGESMSSMRSFMTDCSADAIIPRRAVSPPPPAGGTRTGAGLRRSFSSGSRRRSTARHSGASSVAVPADVDPSWEEDELLDAYFYGATTVTPGTPDDHVVVLPHTESREHVRGSLASPDNFPKPFRNRPPGQFHLPWTPTSAIAPPLPIPGSPQSPSHSSILSATTQSSATTTGTGAEEQVLAIKAVHGESIVAFRTERGVPLADVRARVREKFVHEQDVPLSDTFTLGYRPLVADVRGLAGRARSSSVSSAGMKHPAQLRYIFSQVEWQEAVAQCGAKLTLQVFDGGR